MSRVCELTGKRPMVGKQFQPRQQQNQAPLPSKSKFRDAAVGNSRTRHKTSHISRGTAHSRPTVEVLTPSLPRQKTMNCPRML